MGNVTTTVEIITNDFGTLKTIDTIQNTKEVYEENGFIYVCHVPEKKFYCSY